MNNYIKSLTGLTDNLITFDPRVAEDDRLKIIPANPTARHPFARQEHCELYLRQSYPNACPVCGQLMRKNGFKTVYLRGLEISGRPLVLVIAKQKYLCPISAECPTLVTDLARVQGTVVNHQIIPNVQQRMLLALAEIHSVKDIANQLHVSQATIYRQMSQLKRHFRPKRHWLPEVLALDDFKAGRFATSGMSMALMNGETHELIDVIESRTNTCLRNYFYRYEYAVRAKVKLIVVDLYQPYRSLIRDLFHNAAIVADRYHVVVQAYQALNQVRTQTMKALPSKDKLARALKRYWRLLVKDAAKLNWHDFKRRTGFGGAQLNEREVIDRLTATSDALSTAYGYYQQLLCALHFQSSEVLAELLKTKLTALPKPCQKAQRTLRNHREEIERSFEQPYNNGSLEGTNNVIKTIKRVAFGFRSFPNFRLRILLVAKSPYFNVKTAA